MQTYCCKSFAIQICTEFSKAAAIIWFCVLIKTLILWYQLNKRMQFKLHFFHICSVPAFAISVALFLFVFWQKAEEIGYHFLFQFCLLFGVGKCSYIFLDSFFIAFLLAAFKNIQTAILLKFFNLLCIPLETSFKNSNSPGVIWFDTCD